MRMFYHPGGGGGGGGKGGGEGIPEDGRFRRQIKWAKFGCKQILKKKRGGGGVKDGGAV